MTSEISNGKFDAIIFDMDGLLVDSETVWHVAETDMIEARGHKYTEEVRAGIVGLRMDEFMAKLRDHYGFEEPLEELIDELLSRLGNLLETEVQPQPGAHELVSYVVENAIPYAIASSSPKSVIDATLKSQGWDALFAVRCTADDEARGKPAPDVYLKAAQRLNIDPTKCLALEDSPNGSRAAIAAGMTCYAVPDRSHTDVSAFNDITPHVFDDLHQVLAIIKGEA